eukprot:scaffold2929_cov107-Cylindrotheca_fusiformis.AAC.11
MDIGADMAQVRKQDALARKSGMAIISRYKWKGFFRILFDLKIATIRTRQAHATMPLIAARAEN